jgi:mannosyltransferase OCH1-like enzyme
MNPDWQIDLYYDDAPISISPSFIQLGRKQDYCNYKGLDYFSNLKDLNINIIKWNTKEVEINKFKDITPSGKSNLFKWHQLYKYGGIYADMDILFFRPINELYDQWNNDNINVVICQTKYLSIGLMASTPNNDFFRDIFYNTFKFEYHTQYQTYGVVNVYDLYSGTSKSDILSVAKEKYPHLNIFNLPMETVYHFNHRDVSKCFEKNSVIEISEFPKNAIGYHWYAGGSICQKYNNLLNHKNYMKYNTLFNKLYKHYFK